MPAPDAVSRFSGFAGDYDRARPRPPDELAELITRWVDVDRPTVVDLGAGTGLSTILWSGRASHVIAVEPNQEMRGHAATRLAALPDSANFELVEATAEATGLPDGSADVVTASQAMHWFDPARALPEVARLLRPGGVFAAYDAQWPPTIQWEVDAAYDVFEQRHRALEVEHALSPPRQAKHEHARRIGESGLFRLVREVAVHSREQGGADRLLAVARSQGGCRALLNIGVSEADMGLEHLRRTADRYLATPRTWWWTYRTCLAVR